MKQAGGAHSLFVDERGTVWVCGSNYKQLGLGSKHRRGQLVKLQKLKKLPKIVAVYANMRTSMLVDINGQVWFSGPNRHGMSKENWEMYETEYASFKILEGLPNCIKAIDGDCHLIAVDLDGNVWGCGENFSWQIVNEDIKKIPPFRKLENLPPISAVSAGIGFSLFLGTDGSVWITGSNIGLGEDAGRMVKSQQVPGIPPIKAISAGEGHSLLLDFAGNVWGSGSNTSGQLGLGARGVTLLRTFEQLPDLPIITAIFAGVCQSMFIDEEGAVWGCGISPANHSNVDFIKKIGGLPPINWISLGTYHVLFTDTTGSVWFCGSSACVGIDSVDTHTPVRLKKAPKLPLMTPIESPAVPLKSAAKIAN